MEVAGSGCLQLPHFIQGGWVQRVGIDEAHKIFFVVCPGEEEAECLLLRYQECGPINCVALTPHWALPISFFNCVLCCKHPHHVTVNTGGAEDHL